MFLLKRLKKILKFFNGLRKYTNMLKLFKKTEIIFIYFLEKLCFYQKDLENIKILYRNILSKKVSKKHENYN